MKFDPKVKQRGVVWLMVRVDGSSVAGGTDTTNGLLTEINNVTITENGSGDYSINISKPGIRTCFAVATPETDATAMRIVSLSSSVVRVKQVSTDLSTGVADGDFCVLIGVYNDSSDR